MCVRSICIHPVPDVTEDEKRAKIQSSNIEQDLFEQAKLEVNVIKILLLGKFVRAVCMCCNNLVSECCIILYGNPRHLSTKCYLWYGYLRPKVT